MESDNGASSSTGPLKPVSVSSDVFLNSILTKLQSAYLFEESKQSFRYTSAFLINNPTLEDKYNTCREKRREQGYSEEDLKETYGFLLFEELNKAKSIGESGVTTDNGTCTTLGDPSKGVYLSMYSDCLDQNRWYHGKSGYIAVIRLTLGKVKKVSENYTKNRTKPTVGFDCHVSEQLPSVSSKTSSFLAFERTQYYVYELLDNGNNTIAQSPSLACPYAVVAFSYTDTKSTLETKKEKSEEKKLEYPYLPWMGKLQIGLRSFNVGIRSKTGALILAKLPPEIKVEHAISMLHLRKLLPKSVFEASFSGKVQVDDLFCSLCEIVPSSFEEKEQLTPLLLEIKEKDIALIILLNDGGFLVLIHGSHFISHENDNAINKVFQGVLVFPGSQVIHRATKTEQMKRGLPLDILRVLPLLTYAEGEVEKTSINQKEDLRDVFVHHMQRYATLISPDVPSSPVREISIFPYQYDVPDAHRQLYSTPEWTDQQWQILKSYLSNPSSFQLPVCAVSEILAAGQEAQREDLDDDIYICLSSPEEPSTSSINTAPEERLDKKCPTHIETSHESITCTEEQLDSTSDPETLPANVLQTQKENTDTSDSTVLSEKHSKDEETAEEPPKTDEPSEELIVSITSEAQTVTDEGLDLIKHDDQLSVTAKLQVATLDSFTEMMQSKNTLNFSDNPNITHFNKLHQEPDLGSTDTSMLHLGKTVFESDESISKHYLPAKELSIHLHRCGIKTKKQEPDQLSPDNSQGVEKTEDLYLKDSTLLKELETCTLRKKSERWGLKPVVSKCGRILIPYASVDTEQIKSLQEKMLKTQDNPPPEEMTVDAPCDVKNPTGDEKEINSMTEKSNSAEPTEDSARAKSTEQIDLPSSTNGTDHLATQEPKEKRARDITIKFKTNGEIVLRKLKSVILKKRRKKDMLKEDLGVNGADDELSPKKAKSDLLPETLNGTNDTCATQTDGDDQTAAKMPSVDPVFAHALGLTPKGTADQKTLDLNSVQSKKDLTDALETATSKDHPDKQLPPTSPKGARLKTLKKHQNVSAEQVKKKWWLHFQTPASYAEKQYEACSSDISDRKTVKEKTDTCSSADALNLLADLCARKDKVSQHPVQEHLKEPESIVKMCDFTKDVINPDPDSVLHALLRQSAARPDQPVGPPSPDAVGGTDLIDVICREHAYSLPPSSSLLLALPAPFQVSPLNGSSRLLHHSQKRDGVQRQHPFISLEDMTSDVTKKQTWYRRKFRLSRTIVNKDKSVQVTRHWKEKYDFSLDSRFSIDPKDKAVARALHGPWDVTIHDTTEEVQLIVHMWIGLFYSRSTARLFHLEPDFTFPVSEDNDLLDQVDLSNDKISEQSDSATVSSSLLPSAESQALDLSKPKSVLVDQESSALDLSQKPSGIEATQTNTEVNKKELKEQTGVPEVLNTLKPPGFQDTSISKWQWNLAHNAGIATNGNILTFLANQKTGISPERSQIFIPVWNGLSNAHFWANNVQTPLMPVLLSGPYQTNKTPVHSLERPEFPTNKRVKCQTQLSDKFNSVGPNQNESKISKIMQVNKDTVSSKHVIEIKKKYMEKLRAASVGQGDLDVDSSTSQNVKAVGATKQMEQILEEHTIKETTCQAPTTEQQSENQTLQLNTPVPNKNVFTANKDVSTLDEVATTSVNKETTIEITTAQKSLKDIGLVPDIKENQNSASVPSTRPNEVPAEHCKAMDCLTSAATQDLHIEPLVEKPSPQEETYSSPLPQDNVEKISEDPVTEEINMQSSEQVEDSEKAHSGVEIPFIGIDTPLGDMLQPQTFGEQGNKIIEDMETTSTTSTNTEEMLTTDVKHEGQSQHTDQSENSDPLDCRANESDDRCPTPTIDEQPYEYTPHPNLHNSVNALVESSLDIVNKELSRSSTPVMDESPIEPSPTTLITDSERSAQSDIELRTLRTLQSLDEFLSTLPYKISQIHPAEIKHKVSQTISRNKARSNANQISPDLNHTGKPSSTSDSCSEEVKPSEHLYISPFKDVLGVMQQSKQGPSVLKCPPTEFRLTEPQEQDQAHTTKPISSTEGSMRPLKSTNDTERLKSNNVCPIGQNLVKVERPSKSDYSQDSEIENFVCELQPKPTIKFSIKKTRQGSLIGNCPNVDDQGSSEDFADSLVSNKCRFTFDKTKHGQQQFHKHHFSGSLKTTPTSQSIPSSKPIEGFSKHFNEHDPLTPVKDSNICTNNAYSVDKEFLSNSMSFVDFKTNKITDDSLGNEGSLSCTVSNTKRKRTSFLEKMAKRCLQDDPTQSSMDQESLIFLDQMKQLFKRKKREHSEQEAQQSSHPPSSPVTVKFSDLQELEDLFDDVEIPSSFFKQKISVDMSDRDVSRDGPQEKTSQPLPNGPQEHAGVSAITAECARLYKDIMNKICSRKSTTSLLKDLHVTDSKADSSNYFDFCSQMKREMDESFRNSLNSVVKKSCQTKNRFFLLVTSDDVFFNETMVFLKSEGHTAVHPSDFFHRERTSPLLIIIRNEDIAEHVFEVPQLLELRLSPVVQFSGIDEPDDVINLTYQELFIKGGFVMFDRAAVESLSPGNMKKVLDILQKLSQTGKWKWVLHYRDSRHLKENARLCPDAKAKTQLLNKCKEDGLLEILPYHECDLMSRELPDYLRCLCHQQIQNISARYPVFVTDSPPDSGFKKNGILTMSVNSFLINSLSKTIYGLT